MYTHGIGVDTDFKQGMMCYKQAADKGDASAQQNYGSIYDKGKGVEQDYGKAMGWFKLAAKQGHPRAQFSVGLMYADGKSVPVNLKEAFYWYLKAARAKDPDTDAVLNVGLAYLHGLGVEKDVKQAVEYFQYIAVKGDKKAQFMLGLCYINCYSRESKYLMKAIKWLDQPHSFYASKLYLGYLYEKGLIVNQDCSKDKYYYDRVRADAYIDVDMFNLGRIFLKMKNWRGSSDQALIWFKKAAERGNVHVLVALGSMYMIGLVNGKIDVINAYNYLSQAAVLEKQRLSLSQLKSPQHLKPGEEYNSDAMKWYIKSLDDDGTTGEECMSGRV